MFKDTSYLLLSLYYLFFFSAWGIFLPYWPIYLKEHHYNSLAIGQLMAVFMMSKLIGPLAIGWLADYQGKIMRWIRLSALMTVITFVLLYESLSFIEMAVVLGVFGFFWNGSMPLFEGLTLNHLGKHCHRYSWIRLWGSIGFIIAVIYIADVIDYWGITSIIPIIMFLLIGLLVSTWMVSDCKNTVINKPSDSLIMVLKQPVIYMLLAACILQNMSHGAYYTFYSIYLDQQGYNSQSIGFMWAMGVSAEVALFLVAYWLLDSWKAHRLFSVSLLLTVVRWVLLAFFVDNEIILLIAQLLHAASFALFHLSAIDLIHQWFTGPLQARGQALYAGLSFGLGGAIGSLLSGYLWERGAAMSFLFMASIAFFAFIISLIGVRDNPLFKHSIE